MSWLWIIKWQIWQYYAAISGTIETHLPWMGSAPVPAAPPTVSAWSSRNHADQAKGVTRHTVGKLCHFMVYNRLFLPSFIQLLTHTPPTHTTPLPHKQYPIPDPMIFGNTQSVSDFFQNHRLFQKSSLLTWGACKLCWIFMSVNIVFNHTTFVKPGYVNSHHCKALSTHKFTHFCRDLMSLRFTHFLPLLFWRMYVVNR